MKSFYTMIFDFNRKEIEKYDVMPYLVNSYKETSKKERPTNYDECKEFITGKSQYMFWSRCQYEILVSDWPRDKNEIKIDVHYQIMMNIEVVTQLFMEELGIK